LISKRLILAHFWLAFAAFGLALVLGAWQMFVRSPLNAWHFNPEFYYRSVTAHGSIMGYVLPTLVAMGFGYAISEAALEKTLIGRRWGRMGLLCHLPNRHSDGCGRHSRWPVISALHLLSTAAGERLVLQRRFPPHRRFDDLGGADGHQHDSLEA